VSIRSTRKRVESTRMRVESTRMRVESTHMCHAFSELLQAGGS
jgi:hypothetical protein